MFKVRYEVYIQDLGMFDDDGGELEWQESTEYEYATLEEAQREARENKEGWRGTWVEVYINDRLFREYEA